MLPHLHWRVVTVAKLRIRDREVPLHAYVVTITGLHEELFVHSVNRVSEECVPKSLQHDAIIHGSALDENRIAVNLTIVRIRLDARIVKL